MCVLLWCVFQRPDINRAVLGRMARCQIDSSCWLFAALGTFTHGPVVVVGCKECWADVQPPVCFGWWCKHWESRAAHTQLLGAAGGVALLSISRIPSLDVFVCLFGSSGMLPQWAHACLALLLQALCRACCCKHACRMCAGVTKWLVLGQVGYSSLSSCLCWPCSERGPRGV